MIEENGIVVATTGEEAWVETSRGSSCGSCSAKGCGTGALSQVLGRHTQKLRVKNPIGATSGEGVVLGIDESALLRGSLAVYLVPLLALLGGGLLGEALAHALGIAGEGMTILSAIAAVSLSLWWLRRFNRHAAGDSRYHAVILRRSEQPSAATISINLNP